MNINLFYRRCVAKQNIQKDFLANLILGKLRYRQNDEIIAEITKRIEYMDKFIVNIENLLPLA